MIKEKDRVIVDLEVYDKVKEFGNQNEIISRTKNGIKATVTKIRVWESPTACAELT